ncbi:phosphohydrolase [uncultured Intestinimonas sp.]|uniref:phosphohydrolase n=1 Tax=uncultured Intestinimonas sp. TaxID=1689265 RepID=UPI0025FE1843|nr:phosphohydrolase [uncultured Intestinimonas sp.]
MWAFRYAPDWLEAVSDLVDHPVVRSMEALPQHAKGFSCFHHSALVSYWSWRACLALGLDARSAARGGLLHDLYLYDWTGQRAPNGKWHGTEHPRVALKNAQAFFRLNARERDIILKHMWPLTIRPYRYLESFVVSCVDKVCAVAELLRLTPDPAAFVPMTPPCADALPCPEAA